MGGPRGFSIGAARPFLKWMAVGAQQDVLPAPVVPVFGGCRRKGRQCGCQPPDTNASGTDIQAGGPSVGLADRGTTRTTWPWLTPTPATQQLGCCSPASSWEGEISGLSTTPRHLRMNGQEELAAGSRKHRCLCPDPEQVYPSPWSVLQPDCQQENLPLSK